MNEKTKIVTKDSLIRAIAKQSKKNLLDTKDFYNAFENVIFDILSSVNEEQDMYIKLFEGISLEGNYMAGANIAGFMKVAESMKAQGAV